METYFATPEREDKKTLEQQIKQTSENELINSLMKAIQGLFVVLNDKRQIVGINESFLKNLQAEKQDDIFGLRLGETVKCVYSDLMEGGCGTSEYCSSCGAAISMVTALSKNEPAERICSIRVQPDGDVENLFFNVKSSPLQMDGKTFLLVFLEDITYEQKMAALERVFFHDIYNKVSGIINGCEILKYQSTENTDIVNIIYDLTYQMVREIEFQKKMLNNKKYRIFPEPSEIKLSTVYKELDRVFSNHSVLKYKFLDFPEKVPFFTFKSDISILIRVLTNMIKNALEASGKGEKVRVYHLITGDEISFEVWNKGYIREDFARQIFKRNFTTKKGLGHGFGTYSMKLLGEEMLGGKVTFETSKEAGTTFKFKIPLITE
ncbi:MAG: hypothetical protein JXQ65_07280 [Candidatus Marinimicrobia bacterium]|nr:hypothetical protein [Candidatus Neomarinimicrobiota bacterium]